MQNFCQTRAIVKNNLRCWCCQKNYVNIFGCPLESNQRVDNKKKGLGRTVENYFRCSKMITYKAIGKSFDQKPSNPGKLIHVKVIQCRSTRARHAASPYEPKRHPNAQGKLKHYIPFIRFELLLLYVFLTTVHVYAYVSNTYP